MKTHRAAVSQGFPFVARQQSIRPQAQRHLLFCIFGIQDALPIEFNATIMTIEGMPLVPSFMSDRRVLKETNFCKD
jgi:hypothetical protein